MRAYSMDLRERVIRDSDAGLMADAVAETYHVSGSWVRWLKQRRRETGEIGPRRQRYHARLEPEPPMAVLEVRTFPERASVRIAGEERQAPAAYRLPAGRHRVDADRKSTRLNSSHRL